jgi:hypothetical protein
MGKGACGRRWRRLEWQWLVHTRVKRGQSTMWMVWRQLGRMHCSNGMGGSVLEGAYSERVDRFVAGAEARALL